MEAHDFIKTIYLGDRALKGLTIDSWECVVKLSIDEISRIRSDDGLWNFYNEENIVDGQLVVAGVRDFRIEPAGAIPNDLIRDVTFESLGSGDFRLTISVCSVNKQAEVTVCLVGVTGNDLYLVDPLHPDQKIRV
jgi:hypothetical protein